MSEIKWRGDQRCRLCGKESDSYYDMSSGPAGEFWEFCTEHEKEVEAAAIQEETRRNVFIKAGIAKKTELNRFDFRISALNGVHVASDDNGQYVRFTDYAATQAELSKFREANATLAEAYLKFREQANTRIAELEEALNQDNKALTESVKKWRAIADANEKVASIAHNNYTLMKAEVERLNKWADSFSDAQIKERRTGEMYQRELREELESVKTITNSLHKYDAISAAPQIKERYVRVPVEPTEEMLNAWQDESEARFNRTDMGRDGANYRNRFAYKALIKAAPKELISAATVEKEKH